MFEKEAEEYIVQNRRSEDMKVPKVPKDTVSIFAELKGICYADERYCNSFSPTDKSMVDHFWNNTKTYMCIAFDKNGNEIGDNQE